MRSPGLLQTLLLITGVFMSSKEMSTPNRVIVYIDGFNFYFGLRQSNWQRYYYMDYPQLSANLIKDIDGSELITTKYFTARITAPEDKRIRQQNFIETLELRGNINFKYGNYRDKSFICSNYNCGRPNYIPNEKQTDVNIAVEMLVDAFQNNYDTAILISGDSDLVPPIKEVKRLFPQKKILACFPPLRRSKELRKACSGEIVINEADLKNNQLPDIFVRPSDGYKYTRPDKWK